MGKYIIDVDDKYVSPDNELNGTLIVSQKNLFDGDSCSYHVKIAKLTPYTEDIDAIRKKAYDKGYTDAAYNCHERCAFLDDAKLKEAYQRGLNDAREGKASCQFCEYEMCSDRTDPCRVCACNYMNFFEPKKQKKEEQITKGDVVRIKSAPEVEILVTYADGGHVSGIALTELDYSCKIGDQYTDIQIHKVEKTGEHYEIAEVLQKMKENVNG